MTPVEGATPFRIEIKQRGGKWVHWAMRTTEQDTRAQWNRMPSIRRKARLIINHEVIDHYTPPEVFHGAVSGRWDQTGKLHLRERDNQGKLR